jgi:abhydrolase domain-containing protein 17
MGDAISTLLFQPPTPTYIHPSRHFWLYNTHTRCRIPAFFIERPGANITLLFSHGNAEDLGMIYDWFNDLSRVLRCNIMAYDYTGYGKSTLQQQQAPQVAHSAATSNTNSPHTTTTTATTTSTMSTNGTLSPTEEGCYHDIEAAYNYLLHERNIAPEQIVLYGRSLGSGPSCYLAAKTAQAQRSVAGLILQSPLLSAYRVAFNFRCTMMGDKFPNIDYAPNIQCPVFIIHGTQDEVVPFWHGEDLFVSVPQQWRAKPFWVEGAGHNNIEAMLRPTGTFVSKIIEYLDLHIAARRGRPTRPEPVPVQVPAALRELEQQQHHHHHHHQSIMTNTNNNTIPSVGQQVLQQRVR